MEYTEIFNSVINSLKKEYPDAKFGLEYHTHHNGDDTYEIWYDKIELRDDLDFNNFTGKLISRLWSEGHFNFWIDYNWEKDDKNKQSIE